MVSGTDFLVICENDMLRNGNSWLKMGVSFAAHTQYAYIWKYPPPPPPGIKYVVYQKEIKLLVLKQKSTPRLREYGNGIIIKAYEDEGYISILVVVMAMRTTPMMRRTTRIMKMTITVMLVQGPPKGRTAPHSPPTCFLSEEVIP